MGAGIRGEHGMERSRLPVLRLGTNYKIDCIRDGNVVWTINDDNLVVNQGLQIALGITFGDLEQPDWYMGICTGVTVHSDDTAENHQFVEYLGSTSNNRPLAIFEDSGLVDNKYTYTATDVQVMISEPATLRGVFMTTHQKKGEDAGYLYGVAGFTENKDVVSGDALLTTITVSAQG